METEGRKLWRAVYPVLTYWAASMVISVIFSMVVVAQVMGQSGAAGVWDLEGMLAESVQRLAGYTYAMSMASALLTLPFMLLYRRWDQKRFQAAGRIRRFAKAPWFQYVPVVILGLSSCLLLNNLMNLSGLMAVYETTAEELSGVLYQGRLVLEVLGIGILVPIVEELVFRGVTMSRLEEYWGRKYAILLSAVLFAVIHGNLLQGLYTLPLGLLLAYVRDRYHSLLAPILLHSAANLLSVTASELGYLNFMAGTEGLYWGITVGAAVVVLAALYWVQEKVWVEELTGESESPEGDS